jgi:hypothetical protein
MLASLGEYKAKVIHRGNYPLRTSAQEQYLKLMTLQVCLIGKDGFVLASDKRAVRCGPEETTQCYSTEKIFFNEREGVASCSSGHELLKVLCQILEEELATPDQSGKRSLDQIKQCLRQAVEKVQNVYPVEEQKYGQGKLMLVADVGESIKGCVFHGAWINTSAKWDLFKVEHFTDKMSCGDTRNGAPMFVEKYYGQTEGEVAHLRLAAHTILTGAQLSPQFIGGLEILTFSGGKFRKLLEDELEELRRFSAKVDKSLLRGFRRG